MIFRGRFKSNFVVIIQRLDLSPHSDVAGLSMHWGKTAGRKQSPFLPAETDREEGGKQRQMSVAAALPQQGVGLTPSMFLCQQLV